MPQNTTELWREKERYKALTGSAQVETAGTAEEIELIPFYDAGNRDPKNFREGIQPNSETVTHITFQVWLPYRFL